MQAFQVRFADDPTIEDPDATGPVALDEAQNYSVSALEEIRPAAWTDLAEQLAFALILVGDPYLLSTLRLRSHRALYSRIAAHAQLEKLSRAEIEAYLNHQLRLAGIEADCFEPAAIELLTAASEGIPRAINLIARAAWIEASKENSSRIGATHIQSALERVPGALELRRQSSPSPRP